MVLDQKHRDADRRQSQFAQHTRHREQSGTSLQSILMAGLEEEGTNGKFLALLGFIVTVGVAVGVVLPATASRVVVAAVLIVVVTALLVPKIRRPVSGWLDRNLG